MILQNAVLMSTAAAGLMLFSTGCATKRHVRAAIAPVENRVGAVEKRATHGGTCLNVGCIPSKALLHASELFDEASHGFAGMGIDVAPKLNLTKMLAFKDEGVKGNVDGVAYLLKKNKVTVFMGAATLPKKGTGLARSA